MRGTQRASGPEWLGSVTLNRYHAEPVSFGYPCAYHVSLPRMRGQEESSKSGLAQARVGSSPGWKRMSWSSAIICWPSVARSKLCALSEPLRAGASRTTAIRRNARRGSISCDLVTQVNERSIDDITVLTLRFAPDAGTQVTEVFG